MARLREQVASLGAERGAREAELAELRGRLRSSDEKVPPILAPSPSLLQLHLLACQHAPKNPSVSSSPHPPHSNIHARSVVRRCRAAALGNVHLHILVSLSPLGAMFCSNAP